MSKSRESLGPIQAPENRTDVEDEIGLMIDRSRRMHACTPDYMGIPERPNPCLCTFRKALVGLYYVLNTN